jgi:hypothetical protein
MMGETLRDTVRQKLTMIAAPHQHAREAAAIAEYIGYRDAEERQRIIDYIIEEAQRLHINVA